MQARLLLELLAPGRQARRRPGQGGFALTLAVFVALTVLVGWVALANRSNASRLGAALQEENREARIAAESGIATVINELNRPRNRMLLAWGQNLDTWSQPVRSSSALINPCVNLTVTDPDKQIGPTPLVARLGSSRTGDAIPLGSPTVGNRLQRQFRVIDFRLKNADRQAGSFSSDLINLRAPDGKNPRQGVGYAELIVEGQVLRQGRPAASVRVSQEFQVIPKCCNRSFRGPGDQSRAKDKLTGFFPGLYGDDNRYCSNDFPPLLLGTGNTPTRNTGGLFNLTTDSQPEVRSQDKPNERPDRILCFSTQQACEGAKSVDKVNVVPSTRRVPTVPVLGEDGLPCDDLDLECIRKGLDKAERKQFTSRSIELFNQGDGAKNNSSSNRYAKDYIRVNSKGNVEICNKTYTQGSSTPVSYDTTPTIVTNSCEDMMNVCAQQNINGFISYHCRISNIFVNDFGATDDVDGFFNGVRRTGVRQNNTLFIDSSRAPIYLYVNEDWAKTQVNTNDPVAQQIRDGNGKPEEFRSIYTVGGYNDGQIQHVYCGPRNGFDSPLADSAACVTAAPSEISTRAAILSACRRKYNTTSKQVIDLCEQDGRDNTVNAEFGDDGFARGLFLFMPKSSIKLKGDPELNDLGGNSPQGKPQLAAAVWANQLIFDGRSTQLYVPGRNAEFFGIETSYDDRYAPRFSFDYVARSISGSSLFNFSF